MSDTWTSITELRLLAHAIARPLNVERRSMVAALVAGGGVDWAALIDLVDRHRVAPLAWDGLQTVRSHMPAPVGQALRARAMRDRKASLQLAGVLDILTRRLAQAGVDAISVKGPTLGVLAFGDISMRQSKDVDVLIAPGDLPTALATLQDGGCRLIAPDKFETNQVLQLWSKLQKDLTLVHEPTGTIIELHWRLNNNPHLLPVSVTASRQSVTIGSAPHNTLAADDLLLYLCVHGAKHFWFRLKWLADVYALLRTADDSTTRAFYDRAGQHGLHVPAGQMLVLLRAVFGLPVPDDLLARVARSWRTRWLTGAALRYIAMAAEPDSRRFETTRMSVYRLLLRREPSYALHEVHEMLVDGPAVIARGGTRRAYVMSMCFRPLSWTRRKLSRRATERQGA